MLLTGTFCLFSFSKAAIASECIPIETNNSGMAIDPNVITAIAKANLTIEDFYKALMVVSKYETNGCWGGATGNFDKQRLSAGVMQWNFGSGSIQDLLKRFRDKYPDGKSFLTKINQIMPQFGEAFFDISCRTIPIGNDCSRLLAKNTQGEYGDLQPQFKTEINNLFNDPVMRQIQIDKFGQSVTAILNDLDRVYGTSKPRSWQIAWAIDIKTQQGDHFPNNLNIRRVKERINSITNEDRAKNIRGIVKWYEGLSESGMSDGIKLDYQFNASTWSELSDKIVRDTAREEAVHYTFLISKTAQNIDGRYQADAFQRRATIAFGKGSVHGSRIDFNPIYSSKIKEDAQAATP
jgi:hypothetical protein